jgi:hypothetical protein
MANLKLATRGIFGSMRPRNTGSEVNPAGIWRDIWTPFAASSPEFMMLTFTEDSEEVIIRSTDMVFCRVIYVAFAERAHSIRVIRAE